MEFEKALFAFIDTKYPEIFTAIREEKVISDATEELLVKAITECKKEFLK
jgi:F-type H+-transporting ATPase subunit alpha